MKARALPGSSRLATAVIIGGGQAGLATSHQLSAMGIDHVVLERGEVANSWRSERWDSLRLLTPNWQTQLPEFAYGGDDHDGFMTMPEITSFISDFARFCQAPVHTHTRVTGVDKTAGGYCVRTNNGTWSCRAVVLASGPYNIPMVPSLATSLPGHIEQFTTHQYRNPDQLQNGGVLVVGASATGLQLAQEIQHSGRQVILSVGEHLRMPRQYRGRDIQYWMHAVGLLDECIRDVDDIRRVRGLPSPQLIGHPEQLNLDLNTLGDQGVELVGRLAAIQHRNAQFSGSLANVTTMADLKQQRLLQSIDKWLSGKTASGEADRPAATRIPQCPRLSINLDAGEISTVIWATGFRPDYSWLNVPVLDRKGRLLHEEGVTPAPGLYGMGLPFMRKRKSAFIFGVADDARAIAAHLANHVRSQHANTWVSVA